jgi:hypothetical protein
VAPVAERGGEAADGTDNLVRVTKGEAIQHGAEMAAARPSIQ